MLNVFWFTGIALFVVVVFLVWAAIKLRSRMWKPLLRRKGRPLRWWVFGIAIGSVVKVGFMFWQQDYLVTVTYVVIIAPLLTLLIVGIGWFKVRRGIEREHRQRLERDLDEALAEWEARR